MIGYIKGTIISQQDSTIIVNVNGVGYEVNLVSGMKLDAQEVELFIHTSVSENDISLWGFSNSHELALFKMLLSVSGIGSRTAQSMVAALGISQIVQGIRSEDHKMLKAPGVGKKTAERVILELKSKVDDLNIDTDSIGSTGSNELVEDATAAVESLGYSKNDIQSVIKQLDLSDYESAQSLIKEILKHV